MTNREPTHDPASEPQMIFRPQPRYWLLAGVALGASIMMLWEIRAGFAWETGLFALIGILGGLWALWMATTRIELTPTALRLLRPVGGKQIDNRQLISVSVQGRFLGVLTVLYHPRGANGMIDTNRVASLLAPGIVNAQDLLDRLEERIA